MKTFWTVLASVVVLACMTGIASAAGEEKGVSSRTGTVTITWKDDGEISKITFTSYENDLEEAFDVKLDDRGKKLELYEDARVLLKGKFDNGKGKNSVSVQEAMSLLTGVLAPAPAAKGEEDEEDEEFDKSKRPAAVLRIGDEEEDESGEYPILGDKISAKMVSEYMGLRVEVAGTFDEDWNLTVSDYRCVLTGVLRMQEEEEEEEDEEEGMDEGGEKQKAPQPVFECEDTVESHPLVMNDLTRRLLKDSWKGPIEVVATLSGKDSPKAVTILRSQRLYTGEIKVKRDEEGSVVSIQLVDVQGASEDTPYHIVLDGLGPDLRHYDGDEVTLTGVVQVKSGERWLKVRSIRP